MSQSRGRDLKPPVDGMFHEIFGFGTFFRYHNFQNEIDAWESTVQRGILRHSNSSIDVQCKTICYSWGKICCLGLEHSPHAATQYQQEINYDCIMGAMDANNEFSDPRTG